MEFKYTPEHLRPLVKPERLAEVEAHFRDTHEARQRLEQTLAEPPEWMAAHAYPLSGGGMSEAGFPGFDGLSGLRSSDGSVAPNPVHPVNPVNPASDKLPKWLPRTQFGIARSEVRRWRMAISFQERRSLPRRDCRAALAMTVWGRLPRCARNDSLGKVGTREWMAEVDTHTSRHSGLRRNDGMLQERR